jgi:N-acetylglucosaminyldiphosphoundecaprenol N-acetyl-beta-D-mannosaminyltransferase
MTFVETRVPAHFMCCGVRIDALDTQGAVFALKRLALTAGVGKGVHLCNAFTLSLASADERLRDGLNAAAINLADGTPVAWMGQAAGHGVMRAPVRGMEVMLEVMREGVSWGARHYLYGSTPATLDLLERELRSAIPGVCIVGKQSPPFRALTSDEQADMLRAVQEDSPHFVWIGLGTPKQDLFVVEWADKMESVLVPVGAAFDFAAGTVREAPRWLRGSGLEWAYRLLCEPRRLWRRYLFGNTVFLRTVTREWFTRRA